MTNEALPLMSCSTVRALDARLVARGVASVLLMENAGRGAAECIAARMRSAGLRHVVVLVGPGNNGGDGLVVARHLDALVPGATVQVGYLADPAAMKGDAAVMRDALGATRVVCGRIPELPATDPFAAVDVVVDALFGTGLSRPLKGLAGRWVQAANASAHPRLRIALDAPSGLDVDRGAARGEAVFRADVTCTFAASKVGLHTGAGLAYAGEIVVVGLGVPLPLEAGEIAAWRHEASALAPRPPTAHKGTAGRVLIVGGSAGTTGAALLAARGAHRAGAGLVTVASRAAERLEAQVLETMVARLPEASDAVAFALLEQSATCHAVVLGVGLGRDLWAEQVVEALWASDRPLVVDADALGLLGALHARGALGRRRAPTVLTPHPLELARLLPEEGLAEAAWVEADRPRWVRRVAEKYDAVTLLKGAGSLVATPSGALYVLPYAEAALGVAGSGDVLAGALGARLAERRGEEVLGCTLEAVHAHAIAGRRAAAARGATRGLLASEIAEGLSRALECPTGP